MEFEKRMLLSEEQYLHMVSYYLRENARYPFIHQINYYFDTEDQILRKNHAVLRLRKIAHKHKEITYGLSYKETIYLLNKGRFPSSDVVDNLITIYGRSIDSFKLIAELSTRRLEIKENDYLIALDKNEYNGIIDYNLEIEANNKERAKEVILDVCHRFNIEYAGECKGKSTRVFESLDNN